jgi:hypothetical protein
MTPEEFQAFYPHVIGLIRQTLNAHEKRAKIVGSRGFSRLPLYFSRELLETTKVVAVDRVPVPPLSAIGLSQFAEFETGDYDGITYLDTFFVKQSRAADEGLHFHELIHVMQWRVLGPENFLAAYAAGLETSGYRNSPLECMAYDAQSAFSQSNRAFDAEVGHRAAEPDVGRESCCALKTGAMTQTKLGPTSRLESRRLQEGMH